MAGSVILPLKLLKKACYDLLFRLFFTKTQGHKFDKLLSGKESLSKTVYNNLKKKGIVRGKPTAYVGTHADLLLKRPEVLIDKFTNTPIFTEKTFPLDYSPKAFLARALLENKILQQLDISLVYDAAIDHGFLVKSCISQDGHNVYKSVMNVYDPLIFILNQLGLMDIPIQ